MIQIVDNIKNEYIIDGMQLANQKIIKWNDKSVGVIVYEIKESYVHIDYINIRKEYRRNNIACTVINQIKEANGNKPIHGDSTPSALKFWESLGAKFDEEDYDDYLTGFIIL